MTADTNHSSTPNLRIAHLITSLGTLSKAFSKSRFRFPSENSRKTGVCGYEKDKTIQYVNEARDGRETSAGPYANHMHLAPDW